MSRPCLGGEATDRADVADGIRRRGVRFAVSAVDGARDAARPLGIDSLRRVLDVDVEHAHTLHVLCGRSGLTSHVCSPRGG